MFIKYKKPKPVIAKESNYFLIKGNTYYAIGEMKEYYRDYYRFECHDKKNKFLFPPFENDTYYHFYKHRFENIDYKDDTPLKKIIEEGGEVI